MQQSLLIPLLIIILFIAMAISVGSSRQSISTILDRCYQLANMSSLFRFGEVVYRAGIYWLEKVLKVSGPLLAVHLDQLAALLNAQGKYSEAEPSYKRSLLIYRKAIADGNQPDWVYNSMMLVCEDYGSLLEITGRKREAQKMLTDSADQLAALNFEDEAETLRVRAQNISS